MSKPSDSPPRFILTIGLKNHAHELNKSQALIGSSLTFNRAAEWLRYKIRNQ
jgi:hypothetical protein